VKKRDLIEIGVVLLGLQFFVWAVFSIPGIYASLTAEAGPYGIDPRLLATYSTIQAIILGVLGAFFFLAPNWVSKAVPRSVLDPTVNVSMTVNQLLSAGLVLLGFYFAISGFVAAIGDLHTLRFWATAFGLIELLAELVQLAIGLYLIFRHDRLMNRLSANKALNADASDAGAG